MKYLDKQSVMSILDTFGDEEVYKAIAGLTEYNDDANRVTYGEWLDADIWQLFDPHISMAADNNDEYIVDMNKIIFHTAECSNCHCTITLDDYDNYCPRCGARMSYPK